MPHGHSIACETSHQGRTNTKTGVSGVNSASFYESVSHSIHASKTPQHIRADIWEKLCCLQSQRLMGALGNKDP